MNIVAAMQRMIRPGHTSIVVIDHMRVERPAPAWMSGPAHGPSHADAAALREPDDFVQFTPANELVAEIVERDVEAHVRQSHGQARPCKTLPELHLGLFERMVAHLTDDLERRRSSVEADIKLISDDEISLAGFKAGAARIRTLISRRNRAARAAA